MRLENRLPHFESAFAKVGWFIPPHAQMQFLSKLAARIETAGDQFTQGDLEEALQPLYTPHYLACMHEERYRKLPVIRDYQLTIAEAIEAHFLGLDHIAVAGLVPVVEGAARRIAADYGIDKPSIKAVIQSLAAQCKTDAIENGWGVVGEVASMLDSFAHFTGEFLYAQTGTYSLVDNTNRNGISHGAYADADYGRPLNFYKVIGAIDFLTFVSTWRHGGSWLGPDTTGDALRLGFYFAGLRSAKQKRVDDLRKIPSEKFLSDYEDVMREALEFARSRRQSDKGAPE